MRRIFKLSWLVRVNFFQVTIQEWSLYIKFINWALVWNNQRKKKRNKGQFQHCTVSHITIDPLQLLKALSHQKRLVSLHRIIRKLVLKPIRVENLNFRRNMCLCLVVKTINSYAILSHFQLFLGFGELFKLKMQDRVWSKGKKNGTLAWQYQLSTSQHGVEPWWVSGKRSNLSTGGFHINDLVHLIHSKD